MPCESFGGGGSFDNDRRVDLIRFWNEADIHDAIPSKASVSGDYYGIHALTRRLCEECKRRGEEWVKERSLEFQIWWRDHKIADAKRLAIEAEEREQKRLANQARSKLSPEEILALKEEWKRR